MGNKDRLYSLTLELLECTDRFSEKFESTKISQMKGDFFAEVKPFADKVRGLNEEWRELAVTWIRENRPKHLHEKQIDSSSEQIDLLSVQAFYPDTSRTRFINYLQSVRYILNTLIQRLEHAKKELP